MPVTRFIALLLYCNGPESEPAMSLRYAYTVRTAGGIVSQKEKAKTLLNILFNMPESIFHNSFIPHISVVSITCKPLEKSDGTKNIKTESLLQGL